MKEEEALEAKRQQSRIELEAATRERKAREQAAKRREARRVAERDERAKQVQQRMQELQATWAENKAHSEVCDIPVPPVAAAPVWAEPALSVLPAVLAKSRSLGTFVSLTASKMLQLSSQVCVKQHRITNSARHAPQRPSQAKRGSNPCHLFHESRDHRCVSVI